MELLYFLRISSLPPLQPFREHTIPADSRQGAHRLICRWDTTDATLNLLHEAHKHGPTGSRCQWAGKAMGHCCVPPAAFATRQPPRPGEAQLPPRKDTVKVKPLSFVR